MDQHIASALSSIRGLTFDERVIRSHVLRPPWVKEAVSSKGLHDGVAYPEFVFPIRTSFPYFFDVDGFGKALHEALRNEVAGYVMQLRQRGRTIYTLQWNWAKRPWDGGDAWTPNVPMHVASCSKLLTAIAMTKLLAAHGMSVDTPIIGFLPTYWAKGPNVDTVTFRHLMTHTSGLGIANRSDSDFAFMQACIGSGSTGTGTYLYQNMNFGLCRILVATINGNIAPSASFMIPFIPNSQDLLWDLVTIGAYTQYVQDHVFAPAGVTGATHDHPAHHALAYSFPPQAAGWNSGDLSSMSGGAGWHLSVDELLDVMGAFRRANSIVNTTQAQAMLDAGFGVDIAMDTPLGKLYNKNGLWGNAGGQVEQSLAYFLPRDMEMVLFANSPLGSPAKFFRDVVTGIYTDNVRPRIVLDRVSFRDSVAAAIDVEDNATAEAT